MVGFDRFDTAGRELSVDLAHQPREARFVARGIDVHKNLPEVLKAAHAHKGAAFVEIYQNCIVYNDDVFAPFTAKENAGNQLWLAAGQPMLYAGATKGLKLNPDDSKALNELMYLDRIEKR